MEYFIPAWHGQLIDWVFNTPHIEIYDDVNYMRILRENKKKIGLVLTDYQPQLTTKLNHITLYPDKFFSVYDYLQDVPSLENYIFDYRDIRWPEDASFDLTPFRILVISQGKLYARIIFDSDGKILYIEKVDKDGQVVKKLIMDSRGFISSEDTNEKTIFLDPEGHWRFVYSKKTDRVSVNPIFSFTRFQTYDHLGDLIQEVMVDHFLKQVNDDDHLIVTVDDRSPISLSVYNPYDVIYTANKWHKFENKIKEVNHGPIIVPAKRDIEKVRAMLSEPLPITDMPSYSIQPNLGHSQRLKRQITAVFAENTSYEDLKKILAVVYQRMIKNPDGEGVCFLTYSNAQDNVVRRVLDELQTEHGNEFTTKKEATEQGDNQLEESQHLPILYIKQKRISSINDAYKALDKIRILINWGHSDDFIQTTAISVGIPQLQNFTSSTLMDRKNGWVCHSMADLKAGLSNYLDNLKTWNQALVYDVKLLNRYSTNNLMTKWKQILNHEVEE